METAKVILHQLGGNKFIAMTGAKHLVATERGLQFRIGRNTSTANSITIDLNNTDTYTVKFWNIRGAKIHLLEEYNMVHADSLQELFTSYTGLATHF